LQKLSQTLQLAVDVVSLGNYTFDLFLAHFTSDEQKLRAKIRDK
jgi:hypothetical protein